MPGMFYFICCQCSWVQHFCNHDTVFNLSDELCAGCDSKDELHVIICSEEKNNFIFCFKGKTATQFLLRAFQYLFPPSFPLLQSFPTDAFAFLHLGCQATFKLEDKNTETQPFALLLWLKSEHSVAERSRKISSSSLILIYTDLTKQTRYVFLHPDCQIMTLMQGRTSPRAVFYFPFLKAYLQEATC